jgi:non-canonical (house-cleaning) NTP pyrophosphatase
MENIRIAIGSQDPVIVDTVSGVLEGFEFFSDAEFMYIEVESSVSVESIVTLDDVVRGAQFRAKYAYDEVPAADFGVGTEHGLVSQGGGAPAQVEVCVMYDGHDFYGPGTCPRASGVLEPGGRDGTSVSEAIRRATELMLFG